MPEEKMQVIPPAATTGWEVANTNDQHRSMLETAVSRQAQEVQAAMVVAKKFPRDQISAYQRIVRACERPGLAAEAMYAYPRGGQQVTGPSIRLAEVLAQNWGNLDFGIVELEQKVGVESIVMSYCWDLETNTRQCKVFTVKHERSKRNGNEILTDPRDIYELVSNMGARRLRACILGIIPGDVVDDAVAKCEETLTKKDKAEGPLVDRIKKLAGAFQKQGVTPQMMEMRLGKKSDAWTEFDYSTLKKIFLSIRDGFQKKEDFFTYEAAKEGQAAPETEAPKFEQPRKRKPADPAPEAEKPAPAPVVEKPVEPEPEKEVKPAAPDLVLDGSEVTLQERVANLIRTTSGVDKDEVYRWLVENKVIDKAPERLSNLEPDALSMLVERWDTVTADIRGE